MKKQRIGVCWRFVARVLADCLWNENGLVVGVVVAAEKTVGRERFVEWCELVSTVVVVVYALLRRL